MSTWSVAQCCTRIGASHRRRQQPCQDASLTHQFRTSQGLLVQLMAVADGHGSRAYDRSDVGSQLACQVSIEILRRELGRVGAPPLNQSAYWLEWFRHQLPPALHRHWLQAVEAHSRAQRSELPENDSPHRYGTTLGLVIVTPHWWATGGVGDWDLVQVGRDGQPRLLSEEPEGFATGEATASLCLPHVASLFAERVLLQPMSATCAPFALLLSTDGLRKSCTTDGDFLALCRYLAQAPLPAGRRDEEVQLEGALDQITAQGSGDDTSLALVVFGDLNLRGLVGSSRSGGADSRPPVADPVPAAPQALAGDMPSGPEPSWTQGPPSPGPRPRLGLHQPKSSGAGANPWRLASTLLLGALCLLFGMAAFVFWNRLTQAPPAMEGPGSGRSSPAPQGLESLDPADSSIKDRPAVRPAVMGTPGQR